MNRRYTLFKSLAVLLITLVIVTLAVKAPPAADQKIESFSTEHEKFIAELKEYLSGKMSDDQKKTFESFTLSWTVGTIPNDQKDRIIEAGNALLKKPYIKESNFMQYIDLTMLVDTLQGSNQWYIPWHKAFLGHISNEDVSAGGVTEFLLSSHALIAHNTLNTTSAFKWQASSKINRIEYDNTLKVFFSNINLVCISENDSLCIENTSGVLYPIEKKWVGKKGKVTWVRSGYPSDEIFAELANVRIDLTRNRYEADSVLFTNKDYFTQPALGKLYDQQIKIHDVEKIQVPRFESYEQWYKVKNLFEDIDYEGGFTMVGSNLIGSGTKQNPARLRVKRKNKDFLRLETEVLIFRRHLIFSNNAKVIFEIGKDSIYHTGIGLNYNDKNRTITLAPTQNILTQGPLTSSYHKLTLFIEQLTWPLDQDEITIGATMASSSGRAEFESDNFFNEEKFDVMMGMDEQHPLLAIANYAKRIKSTNFTAMEFSKFLRKPVEQVRVEMMNIAKLGYIYYDFDLDEVKTTSKLYNAIRARARLIDYDVIRFQSRTSAATPNAVLDLNSFDMLVKGVENVSVSDSQNVFLYPRNNQIIIKKNRDFLFDGVVRAGLFTFYGNEFHFDYENFGIDLNAVDSMHIDFKTDDVDFYGKKILENVTSTFEKITGHISIDKPNNKSGLKKNPEYPIFQSTGNSFVYYDDKTIHSGVYKRDSFYFEVYPFRFTKLNDFKREDMDFRGMFYSSDILAPFEEKLVLRPDNSLGFLRTTPGNGLALYTGRGKIFNKIDLSNRGLRSDGYITYITSKTQSDDIYLFPDSMTTISTHFSITQQSSGIQYPKANGEQNLVKWYPKSEKLHAYNAEKPFVMYDSLANLRGNLLLEPLGLTGDGTIYLTDAKMASNLYAFNAMDYSSKSLNLTLYTPSTEEESFKTTNANAFVDLKNKKGVFKKNKTSMFAQMEPLRYESYMDGITWEMQKAELTLSADSRLSLAEMENFHVRDMADRDTFPRGSVFYSVNANEDSLYFFSSKAKYSMSASTLKADSVNYLIVADAVIHPNKKKLEVDKQKRLLPLTNAVVVANLAKRHHRFYNAEIGITGRSFYKGKATMDYVDNEGTVFPITMTELGTYLKTTYADANIIEPDSFKLSPRFAYVGKLHVDAPERYNLFDGGAKPLHSCNQTISNYVKFQARINPDSIMIPVPEKPQSINLAYLMTGSVITNDSIHLYPGLMHQRKNFDDVTLVNAEGYLFYNKKNSRFTIAPDYKITNPDSVTNIVSFNTDFCMLFSEGRINLPINLDHVKIRAIGSLVHKLEDSLLTMETVFRSNFLFNQMALQAMATELNATTTLPVAELKTKPFRSALFTYCEIPQDAQAAINQINLFGAPSVVPKGMESTITFSHVKFRWNQATQSFISDGKLGIHTVGNTQVNKMVDGYIEITKKRSSDNMVMYIQLDNDKYYLFYYTRGSMQVASHNPLFLQPVKETKAKDRKVKVKKGAPTYNYLISDARELNIAKKRFKEIKELITGKAVPPEAKAETSNSEKTEEPPVSSEIKETTHENN